MAEVLMDFPQLTMTLPDGREESIMKRTTLVSMLPFFSYLVVIGLLYTAYPDVCRHNLHSCRG
jgi:hypothetical protein